MDKKKFDEIMDEWAAQAMDAAPDLEPSPEVYQKLEEKKKKPRFALFSWPVRMAAAGIAAALIILVIVMQPPKEAGPFVGLRKGTVIGKAELRESRDRMQVLGEEEKEEPPEKAGKVERAKIQKKVEEGAKEEGIEKTEHEKPPAKLKIKEKMEIADEADKEAVVQPKEVAARPRMEKKPEKKETGNEVKKSQIAAAAPAAPAQILSERIEFQYQPKGSEAIEMLDIGSPREEIIPLSSEDNYRLTLLLPQERYVYVYQAGVDKQIIQLFPNAEFSPAQNPLQAGKTIIIPLPPNWFYVEKDSGEVQIYVVTSPAPLNNWDEIYAEYSRSAKATERKIIATGLLDRIEKDKQSLESQVSVRVFKFTVH
jgi:hypothetical protein